MSRPARRETENLKLIFACAQNGIKRDLFPVRVEGKRHSFPRDRIEAVEQFLRGGIFVCHGQDDSVMPVHGGIEFKELVEKVNLGLKLDLASEDGDRRFAGSAKLNNKWLADELRLAVEGWLA